MKLRLALLTTLIAIASHYYLSNHYYELALGLSSGSAACNVNATFSCDATSASQYAVFLGVPIAIWGAAANTVLLFLIFGWLVGWTENLRFHSRLTFYFSAFIALVSVVMGSISLFVISKYCLVCMLVYAMSFITFELLRRSLDPEKGSAVSNFATTIKDLFSGANIKVYGGFLLAVPVAALLFDQALMKQYGAKEMSQMVKVSIAEWKTANAVTFDLPPAFVKGAKDARFVITEFADFRCIHCKNASPTIAAFVDSHPDARLDFYNFPLDGTCNEGMNPDGISCYLAAAVTCAEKIAMKGADLHTRIFQEQATIVKQSLAKTKELVSSKATALQIPADQLDACVSNPETQEQVRQQAALGKKVGLQGTPTFWVNGKKLQPAQALPVLEEAYNSSK